MAKKKTITPKKSNRTAVAHTFPPAGATLAGLRPNGVKQMLRRLGRLTGLPKVHAHRFRHTFAPG